MNINRLVIANPAGNVTGIVFDRIHQCSHAVVAEAIQNRYPEVEQVIFAQRRSGIIHGQMAGGEFCANAARSLGYIMNAGREDVIEISMSGTPHPVVVATKPGYAAMTMTTNADVEKKDWRGGTVPIVHFEGITHALIYPSHPQATSLSGGNKTDIHQALRELGIHERLASGLIFATPMPQDWRIKPYVFVRNTGTICAETACASASSALALHQNSSIRVLQPSGKKLAITLHQGDGQHKISVGGIIRILWDSASDDITLRDYAPDARPTKYPPGPKPARFTRNTLP